MRTYKEKGRIRKKLTRDRKRRLIAGTQRGSLWPRSVPGQGNVGSSDLMRRASTIARSTPSDSVDPEDCAQMPKFDFSDYLEPIRTGFTLRYEAKLSSFQQVASTLTLPVPEAFWLCRLGHGHTMAKLKGKSLRNHLPSSPRDYT